MQDFITEIQQRVLVYDGSKGVMLQRKGLQGNEAAESWNLNRPDDVREVYRSYQKAGSDVLQTNTFQGNRISLGHFGIENQTYDLSYRGVKLAKEIAGPTNLVAASAGPTGQLTYPLGELTFEQAYQIYKEQSTAFADAGADCIHFETFTNIVELRAAILAAKENTALPIIASCSYDSGKTLYGNPPEVCAIIAESLGATMTGANCSSGPDKLIEVIQQMQTVASGPLMVKPNAGLPEMSNGQVSFKDTPEQFRQYVKEFCRLGVRLIGGCCGTTPEFIRAIRAEVDKLELGSFISLAKPAIIASSYQYKKLTELKDLRFKSLRIDEGPMANALIAGDYSEVIDAARDLIFDGADILSVEFSGATPPIDLPEFVSQFSLNIKHPIVLKGDDFQLLEGFIRLYPGQAGIVKIPGVDALQKKYGCIIIDPKFLTELTLLN